MPDDHVLMTPDDAQVVENVLDDTGASPTTRRWLLERAAVGAAAAGAAGLLGPAQGAFAKSHRGHRHAAGDTPKKVATAAVTAEAFAVTFLTEVIHRGHLSSTVEPVLRAANLEEYRHFRVLRSSGFKPLATRFWIPDAFFGGGDEKKIAAVIETAETLFVNAYLVGITTFSHAGNPTLARYAGEILGVEAEHRALARFVQGKLPNNVAFESYRLKNIDQVVGALEGAGVGFGKRGKGAGAFYSFRGPGNAVTRIQGRTPS